MEPEVQKFAAVALVGLLAFFPVFNQVKDSSLEALTDANHQAKWKSFFKNWDDIPEDEKLEYWDGRSKPPGQGGDFDRDRVDDDARINKPPPRPQEGDRDGDGVPDEDDADPDDPENNETRPYTMQEELIWQFNGGADSASVNNDFEIPEDASRRGREYDHLIASGSYTQFSGDFDFRLNVDGRLAWTFDDGSDTGIIIPTDDQSEQQIDGVGAGRLTIPHTYSPRLEPDSFTVTITGYYRVYEDEGDDV